jgi:hypothetical protein
MSIAKETLFRAIKRGEALLWVGSGFSLYAGYPSGWGLVQILHDGLTPSQKLLLNPNDPLPRYAEQYITLHDGRRNELTRELMRVFTAPAKSLATHELLTKVSFIDEIVTTNYDTLFEQAYGHRLHKVTQGKNIPFGEPNKVTLYKVHGDFQDPDSLVIAEKDFTNFFRKQDEMLWTGLKALMAKRHLVFVGYSLEDPNVKELFEWINTSLGGQMREAFFIAPDQNELTQKRLSQNKLTYIDSTGEQFVEELVAELKENVLPDLKKGLVSQDKTSQFLDRLGMDFGYKNNSQGLDIIHLGKKEGETTQVLSFEVKNSTPGSDALKKIIAGETLDPVRLSAADDFQGVIRVEGLRMPDDIIEAIILPRAAWNKVVDIFFSDGTCFPEVSVKAYGNKKEIRIIASTKCNTAKITVQRNALMKAKNGFHVNLIVGAKGKHYATVQALLENSEILRCLGHGLGFKCMQNGQLIYEGLERKAVTRTVEDAEAVKRRVEDIRLIEKSFSIVFRDFALSIKEWDDVTAAAKLLRQDSSKFRLSSPWTFSLDDSEEGREWKNTFASKSEVGAFVIERGETWTYSFFGWKFAFDVIGMRVLNNAVVKLNNKNKYLASNSEKAVDYIVKQLLDKRIVSQPSPVAKALKPSLDDILEEYT